MYCFIYAKLKQLKTKNNINAFISILSEMFDNFKL